MAQAFHRIIKFLHFHRRIVFFIQAWDLYSSSFPLRFSEKDSSAASPALNNERLVPGAQCCRVWFHPRLPFGQYFPCRTTLPGDSTTCLFDLHSWGDWVCRKNKLGYKPLFFRPSHEALWWSECKLPAREGVIAVLLSAVGKPVVPKDLLKNFSSSCSYFFIFSVSEVMWLWNERSQDSCRVIALLEERKDFWGNGFLNFKPGDQFQNF